MKAKKDNIFIYDTLYTDVEFFVENFHIPYMKING